MTMLPFDVARCLGVDDDRCQGCLRRLAFEDDEAHQRAVVMMMPPHDIERGCSKRIEMRPGRRRGE